MSYFTPHIEAMTPYVPGEQPAGGEPVIKLNTNENPCPPSPGVQACLQSAAMESLRVYPDPRAGQFLRAVAKLHDLPDGWVLAGNGSDNLIMMIVRAAAAPDDRIAWPAPTFPFYETQALIQQARPCPVPSGEDFTFPLQGLIDAKARITFLANPNSPTGTTASNDQLHALAEALQPHGLLVIDEAYADFARSDALNLPREQPNVIVLRTLSKGYSLAGLRLGYAVARPELLEGLWKTKEIYNVSALADRLGAAAIADQQHMRNNAASIRNARDRLADALKQRRWRMIPSEANFLLAGPPDGNAERAYLGLKERRILVRYFKHPRLQNWLRITVGTDEQNHALLDALDEMNTTP